MPRAILLKDAAAVIGIPYRTAAYWVETGVIRPKGYVGKSGAEIPFTVKDVRELAILAQLREVLPLQALRKALKYLRGLGHNPLSTGRFAVLSGPRGKRRLVKICDDGTALELLTRPGQLILPLEDIDETKL